jgi:hypothetical protein
MRSISFMSTGMSLYTSAAPHRGIPTDLSQSTKRHKTTAQQQPARRRIQRE